MIAAIYARKSTDQTGGHGAQWGDEGGLMTGHHRSDGLRKRCGCRVVEEGGSGWVN